MCVGMCTRVCECEQLTILLPPQQFSHPVLPTHTPSLPTPNMLPLLKREDETLELQM